MKRFFAILLTVWILLTLGACGRKAKEESGLIRIGVLEPLSGEYSAEGKREALGIQYANASTPAIQLNGKTYRIELVLRDNGSDAAQSAAAAAQLVDAGCAAVIGSWGDELSAAASSVFLSAGVPAVSCSGSDPTLTRGNDHYFRISALPEFQGRVLAHFADRTLGVKSAYCLVRNGSEEDAALLRAFRETAEALGMKVTAAEFPVNNVDFTPYLNAAKEAGAGVIFAPCELRYAQRIVEQADPNDTPPVLADTRWEDDSIPAALQEKEFAVYITAAYAEGADSAFDAGFKTWMAETDDALAYNGGSDVIRAESVLGYDAYFTVLDAARAASSADKADILAILPGIAHAGAAGSFSFDADGAAQRSALWIRKADPAAAQWELLAQEETA